MHDEALLMQYALTILCSVNVQDLPDLEDVDIEDITLEEQAAHKVSHEITTVYLLPSDGLAIELFSIFIIYNSQNVTQLFALENDTHRVTLHFLELLFCVFLFYIINKRTLTPVTQGVLPIVHFLN